MVRTALFGLVAALVLAAAAPAQAGDCGYGYGYGYYGFWGTPFAYSQGANYVPPYYAIHPPVYYSPHIIMRPYGTSPYAWPATYMPVAAAPRPMVIMNAAVKSVDPRVAASQTKGSEPQFIEGIVPPTITNPYFVNK
jgi:hypothetical protein